MTEVRDWSELAGSVISSHCVWQPLLPPGSEGEGVHNSRLLPRQTSCELMSDRRVVPFTFPQILTTLILEFATRGRGTTRDCVQSSLFTDMLQLRSSDLMHTDRRRWGQSSVLAAILLAACSMLAFIGQPPDEQ
jgi:hypothetical protein